MIPARIVTPEERAATIAAYRADMGLPDPAEVREVETVDAILQRSPWREDDGDDLGLARLVLILLIASFLLLGGWFVTKALANAAHAHVWVDQMRGW